MSETKKSGFSFMNREKRKPISLREENLTQIGSISSGNTLPAVITPLVSELDLAGWIDGNRKFLEEILMTSGAVLFRGFKVDGVQPFEAAAKRICRKLFNENGEHPRTSESANVYQPVFYAPDKQLLWHNENSFNYIFPTKIMFGCVKPAVIGGETPLVDSRLVYREVDTKIAELFEQKQVMYVRNYSKQLGLDWQTVFKTDDRKVVEQKCRESFFTYEWKADGTLRTRSVRPAIIKHPVTGEKTWFNQAQHWHFSCLDEETKEAIKLSYKPEDYPRQCFFGDGSPIEDSIMQEILDVYRKLEVVFPWETGDLVVVENLLSAHGRNAFKGERKLLVAMGDMMNFDRLN